MGQNAVCFYTVQRNPKSLWKMDISSCGSMLQWRTSKWLYNSYLCEFQKFRNFHFFYSEQFDLQREVWLGINIISFLFT